MDGSPASLETIVVQGRARGLYDEQLQREQQEKKLRPRRSRPAFVQIALPLDPPDPE